MAEWFNLPVISGIAGILGLILQLTDSFPKHREVRQAIVFLIIGFFVGSLASSFSTTQIYLEGGVYPSYVFVGGLIALSAFLLIVALFIQNDEKRGEVYIASGVAGSVACVGFVMLALAWAASGPRTEGITLDDYLILAQSSADRRDFHKAIYFTERASQLLDNGDPRNEELERRLERYRNSQIGNTVQ